MTPASEIWRLARRALWARSPLALLVLAGNLALVLAPPDNAPAVLLLFSLAFLFSLMFELSLFAHLLAAQGAAPSVLDRGALFAGRWLILIAMIGAPLGLALAAEAFGFWRFGDAFFVGDLGVVFVGVLILLMWLLVYALCGPALPLALLGRRESFARTWARPGFARRLSRFMPGAAILFVSFFGYNGLVLASQDWDWGAEGGALAIGAMTIGSATLVEMVLTLVSDILNLVGGAWMAAILADEVILDAGMPAEAAEIFE